MNNHRSIIVTFFKIAFFFGDSCTNISTFSYLNACHENNSIFQNPGSETCLNQQHNYCFALNYELFFVAKFELYMFTPVNAILIIFAGSKSF